MGGQWSHRARTAEHRRARAAYLSQVVWGTTPCCRCGQALTPPVQLDHSDDGNGYLGLSHKSCNARAGGIKGALLNGKKPRQRQCAICGMPFKASRGTDGSNAVTCGRQPCLNQLRAVRKAREPDPQPPQQSGRPW